MPQFRSNENPMFRSKFSEDIFKHKYAHHGCETWDALSSVLVDDVCKEYLSKDDRDALKRMITDLKFIPGGRYFTMQVERISFLIIVTCSKAEEGYQRRLGRHLMEV